MKVYSVNLQHRKDRKLHLLHEFGNHKEFDLQIIPAIQNKFGAVGLWRSLILLIDNIIDPDGEYFIFCEDDHQFTEDYTYDRLLEGVENARRFGAEVLLGGVSWFDIAVIVN